MKVSLSWALALALFSSCSERGAENDHVAPAPIAADEEPAGAPRPKLAAVPIDGLPVLGARDALVTIVEFTDYDCPFCAKAEHTIATLREEYGHDLRVAVAENPLPMHARAKDSALTALAAQDTGDFEAVHGFLFAHQDAHSDKDLDAIGETLHLGRDFQRARSDGHAAAALARSTALTKSLHVQGTPTFFVNGRRVKGAQPLATFETVVREELAHARSLVASGVARQDVYDAILKEARANPAPLDEAPENEPAAFVPGARGVDGALLYGKQNAPSTIVLFSDFECPYCAKLDLRLRSFVEKHPDTRVVLRQRPLPMHAHARLAAKAAIAADAQGKLSALAPAMFDNQRTLDRDALIAYAAKAGLDTPRFQHDLDSAETTAKLEEDEALAQKLDVRGTPTSFIEGHRIVGAQPDETFEEALTKAVTR